jgi:hypothetical protein
LPEITSILILFAAGTIAGFINVMAGGGSSITLPILIFLGLDATVANGTNRIAILIQNISAIKSFKNEQYSEFKISFKMALFALPGAIVGALFAVRISGELFEKILAIVMIGIIISMIVPKKKHNTDNDSEQKTSWAVYLAMFGIGFYGGFIQVGVGFLLMAALQYLMRINLVLVNMHKVFIILIYTFPALIIFIATDNVNWALGLTLAAGNALGAWWAAKMAVKKGEKLIKGILIAAIFLMSLKLLEVF